MAFAESKANVPTIWQAYTIIEVGPRIEDLSTSFFNFRPARVLALGLNKFIGFVLVLKSVVSKYRTLEMLDFNQLECKELKELIMKCYNYFVI